MRVAAGQGIGRMPRQVLMFFRRNAGLAHHRDVRMPQAVKIAVTSRGVAVGQEVASFSFGPLRAVLGLGKPRFAGGFKIALNPQGCAGFPLSRPKEIAGRFPDQERAKPLGHVAG